MAYRFECPVCGGAYAISASLLEWISRSQLTGADRLQLSHAIRWQALNGTPLFLHEPEDLMQANADFGVVLQAHGAVAIGALLSAGEVPDPWRLPIHAVDRATGLSTPESKVLVQALFHRDAIRIRTRARDAGDPSSAVAHWWERGE